MSTSITTPKNVVPVGQVTIGGTTYDVKQHPEFVRFFFDLFRRVGGSSALTNADLEALILDASVAPGQPQHTVPRYDDALLAPAYAPVPVSDVLTPPYEPVPAVESPDGRLQALESRVEQMFRAINDLQQGTQP